MGNGLKKIINYTKEAFLWPFHLVALGFLGLGTAAGVIAMATFDTNPAGLFFIAGGLELAFLGMTVRSRRFRKAIHSKYNQELRAFAYVKQLTEYFNGLSAPAQRRFEAFREQLLQAKNNYSSLNDKFPDLVKQYLGKIESLQMNYMRLLASYDRLPELMAADNPNALRRQIDEIRGSMGDDSPKLRDVKEKRIALLQKRMRNYHQALENGKLLEQQLKTIEETMKFFVEQSIADASQADSGLLDSLLTETSELHDTLNEVEEIMRSDLSAPSQHEGSGGNREILIN